MEHENGQATERHPEPEEVSDQVGAQGLGGVEQGREDAQRQGGQTNAQGHASQAL